MNTSKIIKAYIGTGTYSTTESITQGDYGYILQIEGAVLPSVYRVDFSNNRHDGEALPVYGNEDGVEVPEELIATGKDIFAFYYYIEEGFGKTAYTWKIPNDTRANVGDREPTPTQQDSIDQLIVRSNEAVEKAEQAKADAESAMDNAQTYANNAQSSAQASARSAESASQSAQTASEKATASAQSASEAEQAKIDAQSMVDDAQSYARESELSATASANFASDSQGYASNAQLSATQASNSARSANLSASDALTYANTASSYAQTASTKASEAVGCVETATQKATESAQSASQALGYKNDAESAKTASQTAQGLAESARDSAVSAKDDAESAKADAESARDEAQQAVASISGALAEKAPVITDTASGAIASFTDGADDLPLKSLVVNIDPVQDLHGQDAPYPAGGGKNILDPSLLKDQAAWNMIELSVKPNTSYIASTNKPQSVSLYTYFNNTGTAGGGSSTEVYNGHPVTVTSTADGKVYFSQRRADGTDSFQNYHFQLELGSTATAYAPYENLCPISGWTEVDVEQRGVNVWDEEWELGIYSTTNGSPVASNYSIRGKNRISVKANTSYYCNNSYFRVLFYDANDNFISYVTGAGVKTTPSNCAYIRFYLGDVYGTTYNHDISINYPSTDHSYHPYTGRSITIDLGRTVYGGKLDVLSGELVVNMAMVDLGTLTWFYISQSGKERFYSSGIKNLVKKPAANTDNANIISSAYETFNVTHAFEKDKIIAIYTDGDIFLRDTSYTDTASLKTALSGVQLVYKLATPLTYTLDPQTVRSLIGNNNIWADSGDVSAEYRADTKLYIEKLTQPEEDDMVADSAITSGKFFMVGNTLYRALANIASGATITVGTNAQRVSLSDALNLVNT